MAKNTKTHRRTPRPKGKAASRTKSAAASAKKSKAPHYVYYFGDGRADGDGKMKPLLGGKGANLAEMTRIGLPVPPGFTVTTEVCTYFYAHKRTYPAAMHAQVEEGVRRMERIMGAKFGDTNAMPLLLAVRSGARDSMPGMMDTILNLGLNDQTVSAVVKATKNERFAWDCYRRFIQMYGDVVMGVQKMPAEDHEPFETVIHQLKHERHHKDIEDTKLSVADLKELVARFKKLVKQRTGKQFPDDPWAQLEGSLGAVFGSWMNDRAVVYRRKYHIPQEWGTAVNVQAMVFGNTGENSGSGVAFTRDPATGRKVFYGEFLINAQGEDVVAGVRTPEPVADLKKHLPKALVELERIRHVLEAHFKDVQDFEFTIQDGKVFMLQTRNGKRTGVAAVKFACDMVREKLIDWKTAVNRVPADQLDQVLAPVFDRTALENVEAIASGLPAGPGAATGKVYFNADRAAAAAAAGEKVLLVRIETSPEDLRGMIAAEGILTARGGVSSHAALVARQMGKVCICGAAALNIDYRAKTMTVGRTVYQEGEDYLSIDGTSGTVYAGQLPTAPSEVVQGLLHGDKTAQKSETYRNFNELMGWCAKVTRMSVRTNADTPEQVKNAVSFGASGIGLCRTEHMFFEGDRIDAMREMILAKKLDDRQKALTKLLPYQKSDFIGIYKALQGKPATIRLLDPPLHEFLPQDHAAQSALADKIGVSAEDIARRVHELHEQNPMLGHRGCRLGISFPEVTEMQARAIFEAAAEVQEKGTKVHPEVMIPLVGFRRELELQVEIVRRVAAEVMKKNKTKINYLVGTMIEVPRGALTADEIAETAEFFSFGTNDLTQMGLGMSRDDSGSFLPQYAELEIVKGNPFATIDQEGIGQLMQIAVEKGRKTRPAIKLGICGEHGGDPNSVKFCHRLGLDYVSCSPFRVPIARLAAAQAALAK
jgi:pyruvate,orthophosphate dikinase